MKSAKTQITFAPNVENIDELGANWYNVVLDIVEYLESKGFVYSRTLGFVADRKLDEKELFEISEEIIDLALGEENLFFLRATYLDNVQDMTSLKHC